jgi:hypothetical protein
MMTTTLTKSDIEALVDAIQLECDLSRMDAWMELRDRDPRAFEAYAYADREPEAA